MYSSFIPKIGKVDDECDVRRKRMVIELQISHYRRQNFRNDSLMIYITILSDMQQQVWYVHNYKEWNEKQLK